MAAADASPSWSGFSYQGKVAIYYALRVINEESVGTDFSNHSLMLENIEDFEILRDGSPVSLHQVKAYNLSAYSKYANALLGIALELYKRPNVNGKIHTWKPINSKPAFSGLTDSIKDDLSTILKEYENKGAKDRTTILAKAASSASSLPKQAAILRSAFKGCTSGQLYSILASILNEENDALSRLEPYQYDDGDRFCDIGKIKSKIQSEISSALSARNLAVTYGQLEETFLYFLGMMDAYITTRHKEKRNDEKIPIAFNEIIQALETDHEDISKDYLAFEFKERFAHLIDEFMSDSDDYVESEEGKLCNLKEARKILLGLGPQELWEHYRSFSPHSYLKHDNNTRNALEVNEDGVRDVLINTLYTINCKRSFHDPLKHNFSYRTTTQPCQYYLPTTITVSNSTRIARIEQKITKNFKMSEPLYEVENLIYDGRESRSFLPDSLKHTEAPLTGNESLCSKRNEVLANITLVPILTAKDALA